MEVAPSSTADKSVNLNADDRFVATKILRAGYLHYEESLNPTAINYVPLDDNMELGIVSSAVPELARAISSLLSRSLEDARNDRGGHLPTAVVRRVQTEIISPWGVANLWGTTGHRFVLSRRVDDTQSELLATILVGRSKDTVFFFTGRYNNLRHSTIKETVDFDQPNEDDPTQRWFDRFAFPEIRRFKPQAYHHIANFVVAKEHRKKHLSSFLLKTILQKYARDYIETHGLAIEHSQYLLCGRGYWQIGDPPWLSRMEHLGFYLRWGAESFFIEHDWAPLPTIFDKSGAPISNLSYNKSFGLPELYTNTAPHPGTDEHLMERVPTIVALSQRSDAKLQYFQTMYDFL
jgi:GNAT superfamily N-acetyltransferase